MDCLGGSRGEKTVSNLQRVAKRIVNRIAKEVSKNNLFEQEGERVKQNPISPEKSQNFQKKDRVIPASNAVIEEHLLQARVVNYWATWCEPCVEELPLLAALQKELGAESILGISWDLFQGGELSKVCADIERMKDAFGLEYSSMLIVESPEQFFEHFEVEPKTVPQTIVFSKNFERLYHCKEALKKEDIEAILALLQEEQG